jgi:CheY-like chemotaxis protein
MRIGNSEVSRARHKKSIFVVEDNDDLRSLLLDSFEKEGYEVTGASDGGVAQDREGSVC